LSSIKPSWALHNSLKGWTLYSLTDSDVMVILLTMSENEIKLARISRSGSQEWASLNKNAYANFFSEEFRKSHEISEDFPVLDARNDVANDTAYFIIKPAKVVHPRLHERHEVVANCTLVGSNNKTFTTETIDLSEGGLYFKEVIPSWVAGYFLVIVNEKYQLMCSLVEDQKEKKRVQIVSEESDAHFMKYKDWINGL
jgi:hypothetical protein